MLANDKVIKRVQGLALAFPDVAEAWVEPYPDTNVEAMRVTVQLHSGGDSSFTITAREFVMNGADHQLSDLIGTRAGLNYVKQR